MGWGIEGIREQEWDGEWEESGYRNGIGAMGE